MIAMRDARRRGGTNCAGMAVSRIPYLYLALILTNLCAAARDSAADAVRCQFGKPMRKQVSAEPLNGMCLRDIVSHLSETLRSVVNEELGASTFQKMVDSMGFVSVSSNLDEKLSALVNKSDTKLAAHFDVFKQVDKVLAGVLGRSTLPAIYSSQMIDYDTIEMTRASDTCTEIVKGVYYQNDVVFLCFIQII